MKYWLIIPMTFLGSLGAFYFKKARAKANSILQLAVIPDFYSGGILYVLSAVLNVILLRHLDYSTAYPMTALTYVWTTILSYFLLKERISTKKLLGIFLIILGVVLIAG